MIIIQATVNGLETFVVLISETEQRAFMSHAHALSAALSYVI